MGEAHTKKKKGTKCNQERNTENVPQIDICSDSCRQSRQAITTVMQREIRAKHRGRGMIKKRGVSRERERNTSKKERDRWTIYTQQQFSEALNNASEWVRSSAHATHDSFAFQHHWRRFFFFFFFLVRFKMSLNNPVDIYTNQKKNGAVVYI